MPIFVIPEQESKDESKRGIALNNLPISIFTPKTNQFITTDQAGVAGVTGPTGATGATGVAFAMLRRTYESLSYTGYTGYQGYTGYIGYTALPGYPDGMTALFSGDIATFDEAFQQNIDLIPTNLPTPEQPSYAFKVFKTGSYLINFSYVGNQETLDLTNIDSYVKFDLLIDNVVQKEFMLINFGTRQSWYHILPLDANDVVFFKAASLVPFMSELSSGSVPSGVQNLDALIVTVQYLGTAP